MPVVVWLVVGEVVPVVVAVVVHKMVSGAGQKASNWVAMRREGRFSNVEVIIAGVRLVWTSSLKLRPTPTTMISCGLA